MTVEPPYLPARVQPHGLKRLKLPAPKGLRVWVRWSAFNVRHLVHHLFFRGARNYRLGRVYAVFEPRMSQKAPSNRSFTMLTD